MSQKSTISNDIKQKTKELTINSNEIYMTKVSSSSTNYELISDNNSNQQNENVTETDFNQIMLPDYDRIKTVGQGKLIYLCFFFFFVEKIKYYKQEIFV